MSGYKRSLIKETRKSLRQETKRPRLEGGQNKSYNQEPDFLSLTQEDIKQFIDGFISNMDADRKAIDSDNNETPDKSTAILPLNLGMKMQLFYNVRRSTKSPTKGVNIIKIL